MKELYGYTIVIYHSKGNFDHVVFFDEYEKAKDYVDNYIFEGFIVLCEEARILVPDLFDGVTSVKGLDFYTDCDNRGNMENNEVKNGLLSPYDR